jgi:hypothetical protein
MSCGCEAEQMLRGGDLTPLQNISRWLHPTVQCMDTTKKLTQVLKGLKLTG